MGDYIGRYYRVSKRDTRSVDNGSYELLSKLVASPSIAPMVVPYNIPPYIIPYMEFI